MAPARLPLMLAALIAGLAACDAAPPGAGAGDVVPPGFDDSKADQTCDCGEGGALDDDALLIGVNRAAQLARAFTPDTVAVPEAYRTSGAQLRPLALGHFMDLADEARAATGRTLRVGSGYRSFCVQCALFARYASQFGEDEANTFSAHAGHSEHQLGTTMDVFNEQNNFLGGIYDIPGTTAADPTIYQWLDANAWRHGFMNSYPPNQADDGDRFASRTFEYTKYIPEPWHWRFVGQRAAELHHRLATETGVRYSTHEFVDLIHDPDGELGQRVQDLMAELGVTLEDLEAPHPDDEAALARAFDDVRCGSATLGHDVGQDACVQVNRAGCGLDRCGWFACDRGAWVCTEASACGDEVFANAACPAPMPAP